MQARAPRRTSGNGPKDRDPGPVAFRATVDAARFRQEAVSARYPTWMIVLLAIILLLIWLIYRTGTGWKPLIPGG